MNTKLRTPKFIRSKLMEAFSTLVKGPCSETDTSDFTIGLWGSDYKGSESERIAYRAGYQAANHSWRLWINTWVIPPLRRSIAWVDGVETARDLEHYAAGHRYEPPKDV